MSEYANFIPENIAPPTSTGIMVYDSKGKRVGTIALGNLIPPPLGRKLYSFGAISDVHIGVSTAEEDLTRALKFFKKYGALFTCCAGDLANSGTLEQLKKYYDLTDDSVHNVLGNHDWWGTLQSSGTPITAENYEALMGEQLYYSFEQGDDVFIMFSMSGANNYDTNGGIFTDKQLQWLYETLEANRNKRCFIFEHIFPSNSNKCCGNAYNLYGPEPMWHGKDGKVFESLLRHYKNVILFHGHSHIVYELQTKTEEYPANYDKYFGIHSIHLSSITQPRIMNVDGTSSKQSGGSQGSVVDVYKNHIVVRGRDFVKEKFLPIATYCLDTTLVEVEAGTYVDDTGIIVT